MKQRVVRIEHFQLPACAALYFVLGLLLPLFILFVDRPSTWSFANLAFTLLVPFGYALLGGLMGGVGAWVYNAAALRVGGLELTLSPAEATTDEDRVPTG